MNKDFDPFKQNLRLGASPEQKRRGREEICTHQLHAASMPHVAVGWERIGRRAAENGLVFGVFFFFSFCEQVGFRLRVLRLVG